jgi:hypothetical protein
MEPRQRWWVARQDWTKSALLGVPSLFGELQNATQEYCEPGFDGSLPNDGVPLPAGLECVVTLVGSAGLLPGGADGGDSGTGTGGGVVSASQASMTMVEVTIEKPVPMETISSPGTSSRSVVSLVPEGSLLMKSPA